MSISLPPRRSRLVLLLALLVAGPALTACRPAATLDPGAGSSAPPAPATFEASGQAPESEAPGQSEGALADVIDAPTLDRVRQQPEVVVIDVREPDEYAEAHIPGTTLIPLGQVPDRVAEIPKDRTVILTCRTGNRSGQAATWLRSQGYEDVHNLEGGILAWQKAGLPTESGAP